MGKITFNQWFWISLLCLLAVLAGIVPSAFGCAACGGFGSDIYVRVHVAIEDNSIKQIDVRWDLSEMLSQSLLEQYDVNGDGILDDKEANLLTAFFSEALRPSVYFTTITVNEQKPDMPVFESPRFEWQPAGAVFTYSIPVTYHIEDMLDITFHFMDPDFHFMFYYRPDSVTWNQPKGYRLSHNARMFPQILKISIQPENGSTVIPSPQSSHPAGVSDTQTLSGMAASRTDVNVTWNQKLMATLSDHLQDLHKRLKTYLYDIKTHNSYSDLIWLILFAFVYGLLHAAGPGHGKSLVASYFFSHANPAKKALGMSLLIGVVHVFSAFVLTAGMLLALNLVISTAMQQATLILTRLSGGLIILIAGYLAMSKVRSHAAASRHHQGDETTDFPLAEPPSCTCAACRPTSYSTDAMVVMTAGIVPCPGTVTIFLFAISLQVYLVGFLAATAMSLGMGMVIFTVSYFSITFRNRLANRFRRFIYLLQYAAIIIILILGIVLLLVDVA